MKKSWIPGAIAFAFFGSAAAAQTTVCYSYDETGRLVGSDASTGEVVDYQYDLNDNREQLAELTSGGSTCATLSSVALGALSAGTVSVSNLAQPSSTSVVNSVPAGSITTWTPVLSGAGSPTIVSIINHTPNLGTPVINSNGLSMDFTAGLTAGTARWTFVVADTIGGMVEATATITIS